MKIKAILQRKIINAINDYDFESILESTIENMDLNSLIENKLKTKIQSVDMEDIINSYIDEIFDENFSDYDLQETILEVIDR